MLIDGLEWSHVDYLWIIVMFSSAVLTLILTAPIHCRGSIGEQVKKVIISWMTFFVWTIPYTHTYCHTSGLFVCVFLPMCSPWPGFSLSFDLVQVGSYVNWWCYLCLLPALFYPLVCLLKTVFLQLLCLRAPCFLAVAPWHTHTHLYIYKYIYIIHNN